MIRRTKRPDISRCAQCGGVAVLCGGINGWWLVECEHNGDGKWHTGTILHASAPEAVAAWERNVKHESEERDGK